MNTLMAYVRVGLLFDKDPGRKGSLVKIPVECKERSMKLANKPGRTPF